MRGFILLTLSLLFLLGTLAFAGPASADIVNVVFLHTGDTEGHLFPFHLDDASLSSIGKTGKPVGGVAKRHMFFSTKRQHKKLHWVVLDSGNALGGTPLSNLYQGYVEIEMMNKMKYDAMCLGTGEFRFGMDVLKDRIEFAEFPALSANVTDAETGRLIAEPYTIIERGGLKIGIIGLISPEAADRINPAYAAGLVFADPILTAKTLVPMVIEDADVVVALTHIGVSADIQLASQVPEINIIIGGMSETELEVPMRVGDTLIVHSGKWGYKVGMLKVTFEGDSENGWGIRYFDETLIPMDGRWVDNTDILGILKSYDDKLGAKLGVVVSELGKEYSNLKVKASETELGNLTADVARKFAGTDLAYITAASIRGSLPEGPVTVGDIYNAYPFDHVLVTYEITGSDFGRLLSQGAGKIGQDGFPSVSGATFGVFDGRAYEVTVGGMNLVPDSTYTIVTTDYVARGGDGYGVFQDYPPTLFTGVTLRDAVEAHMQRHTAVSAEIEGRIYFLTEEPSGVPVVEEPVAPVEPIEDMEGELIPEGEIVNLEEARAPEEAGVPEEDEGQPPMVEEVYLGIAEITEDDLHYAFAVSPGGRENEPLYEFRLVITNAGDSERLLNFRTNQRVEFYVKDGGRVVWRWGARRYWPPDVDSLTLGPGESLTYTANWNGLENSGIEAGRKLYKFEAEFLASKSQTVGFMSLLEWTPSAFPFLEPDEEAPDEEVPAEYAEYEEPAVEAEDADAGEAEVEGEDEVEGDDEGAVEADGEDEAEDADEGDAEAAGQDEGEDGDANEDENGDDLDTPPPGWF